MKARIRVQWSGQWSPQSAFHGFRTGVSLHSHTLHSRESLDFFYKAAKASGFVRRMVRQLESGFAAQFPEPLNLCRAWWTPPLAPMDAYRVEARQIEDLGLKPLVSITD